MFGLSITGHCDFVAYFCLLHTNECKHHRSPKRNVKERERHKMFVINEKFNFFSSTLVFFVFDAYTIFCLFLLLLSYKWYTMHTEGDSWCKIYTHTRIFVFVWHGQFAFYMKNSKNGNMNSLCVSEQQQNKEEEKITKYLCHDVHRHKTPSSANLFSPFVVWYLLAVCFVEHLSNIVYWVSIATHVLMK